MIDINKAKTILVFVACFVFVLAVASSLPTVFHSPAQIVPQGAGSTLDADLLDGFHYNEIIDEAKGGNCYMNWDSATCNAGFTKIKAGKITVSSDPDYGSGGVMCANIGDQGEAAGWGIVVEQSNLDCALCCR